MNTMPQEIYTLLLNNGFSQNQLGCSGYQKCVTLLLDYFATTEGKNLALENAKTRIFELEKQYAKKKAEFDAMVDENTRHFDFLKQCYKGLLEAEQKYGEMKDPKLQEAFAFNAALIREGIDLGVDKTSAYIAASYCLYAYLGGQARQVITPKDFISKS